MKKIASLFLATIVLLLNTPVNVSALTPPRYPAPIFYCKAELITWLKTADADSFHEGNFRNVLPQVRERGEILLPVITDDRITFQGVEVLRFAQRGATLHFRYMTPTGQLVVSIEEIDPRFASEYERDGIEAYFAAMDSDRYERELDFYMRVGPFPPGWHSSTPMQRPSRTNSYQIRQRQITLYNSDMGAHKEHEISYVFIENPGGHTVFILFFIVDGFLVHVQISQAEIATFLDGLAWERTPIIYGKDNWQDITPLVNILYDWWETRLDRYQANIYYDSDDNWGMTVGRITAADYSRDGYFVISLSGWNGCTACVTEIAAIRDTGNEITIALRTWAEGEGGQAMTEWGLFLEIPVVFSDRAILIDNVRIPPSYCGIRVFLNGERLAFDIPPQIINGRTMVPMRGIFEALGARVFWDEETQTIGAHLPHYHHANVHLGNTGMDMQIGSNLMTITNRGITGIPRQVELDVAPQIINDRTLVPLRAVSEVFGADVHWCGDTRTVNIRTADYF